MEIVRVETRDGSIYYGCETGNQVYRLEGDLFGKFSQSEELLEPVRRLAPIEPTAIYAIGLNYRSTRARCVRTPDCGSLHEERDSSA